LLAKYQVKLDQLL